MHLFLDSANIDEIKEAYSSGLVQGITTNPSLIKKEIEKLRDEKINMEGYINRILQIANNTPVSLEVCASDYNGMVKEALNIKKIFKHDNICVKIPVCTSFDADNNLFDGVMAIKELSKIGIKVNSTLVFTPEQALLAANAGASYVSPFAGRIDDYLRDKKNITYKKSDYFPENGIGSDDNGVFSGIDLVKKCVMIFRNYNVKTKIITASIRNARQCREAALAGADIATVPYYVLKDMLRHPKTIEGMKLFTNDIVPEYKDLISNWK